MIGKSQFVALLFATLLVIGGVLAKNYSLLIDPMSGLPDELQFQDDRKYKGFEYDLGSPYETEKPMSYLVSQVGSYTYMLNGTTGRMQYYSTNSSNVITSAIGNATGTVFVKSGSYSASVTVLSGVRLVLELGVTGITYTVDSGGTVDDQNGEFDPSVLNDGAYWGNLINGTAGEILQKSEVVFLDSDGKYYLADCNSTTTMYAVALALEDISANAVGNFLIEGYYCNTTWSFTVGSESRIYVGATAGAVTETVPSTSGDQVQAIGYAATSDTVYFDFDSTVIEIA